MTQKTTLPTTFVGPGASGLPQFIPAAPVSAGLIRRWAAAALQSESVGLPVASLPELTGLGSALVQATPSFQPTARQAGSIRYVEFASHSLAAPATGSASPTTFAVVGRYRGKPVAGYWPIFSVGGGDAAAGAYSRAAGGIMTSNGSAQLNGGGDPGTGWHVFIASYDGAASVARMDATEVIGNAGTVASVTPILGVNTSGVREAQIDVAEILLWDRSLTLSERDTVVANLKATYGI